MAMSIDGRTFLVLQPEAMEKLDDLLHQ
jgi:hypothetical protein